MTTPEDVSTQKRARKSLRLVRPGTKATDDKVAKAKQEEVYPNYVFDVFYMHDDSAPLKEVVDDVGGLEPIAIADSKGSFDLEAQGWVRYRRFPNKPDSDSYLLIHKRGDRYIGEVRSNSSEYIDIGSLADLLQFTREYSDAIQLLFCGIGNKPD